jgi:hypothetical protein
MRLALATLAAAVSCALVAGAAAAPPAIRDVSSYRGLGTWVDIWDRGVWRSPEASVAAMRAWGVDTLYVETSNYRQSVDLIRPDELGRLVDDAHAQGMKVVAWYLPSFAQPALDLRRALAAIDFTSPGGGTFDSFALDVEASVVASPTLRTARAVALARLLRTAVGDEYPLGAIVPAPRGMDLHPRYWPGFPYQELAQSLDVFLPMAYFTYRARTAAEARAYTIENVALLRERTGQSGLPVHVVGGIAGPASVAQVKAFVDAATASGTLGASLYDFVGTTAPQWRSLAAVATS